MIDAFLSMQLVFVSEVELPRIITRGCDSRESQSQIFESFRASVKAWLHIIHEDEKLAPLVGKYILRDTWKIPAGIKISYRAATLEVRGKGRGSSFFALRSVKKSWGNFRKTPSVQFATSYPFRNFESRVFNKYIC